MVNSQNNEIMQSDWAKWKMVQLRELIKERYGDNRNLLQKLDDFLFPIKIKK